MYFLCAKFPRLTPLLVWLTKFNVPPLFTVLFGLHFTYYIFLFERVSFVQFLMHVRNFAVNPFLRKKQPLTTPAGHSRPAAPAASNCPF